MEHENFVLTVIARAQKSGAIDRSFDHVNGSILSKCGKLWFAICKGNDEAAKLLIGKIAAVILVGDCIVDQLYDEYVAMPMPNTKYTAYAKDLIPDLIIGCMDREYSNAYATISKIACGCNFDFMECCELALIELINKDESKDGK